MNPFQKIKLLFRLHFDLHLGHTTLQYTTVYIFPGGMHPVPDEGSQCCNLSTLTSPQVITLISSGVLFTRWITYFD